MTSYTVTITADDDSGHTTTLRLDVSGDRVRLTDLHLHAGQGLSTGQLPAIDFGLLLHAVNPGTATPIHTPAQPAESPAVAGGRRRRAGRPAAGRGARRPAATAAAAPGAGGRGRGRKAVRAAGDDRRAYRRTPDDLVKVYQRVGSATAIAQHYQVPRHTVHGWLRRLREQGLLSAD